MKIQRNAIESLEKWKNKKSRKPLILQGARQVGKTWLLKEFGKSRFKDVVVLYDFSTETRFQHLFSFGGSRRFSDELVGSFGLI